MKSPHDNWQIKLERPDATRLVAATFVILAGLGGIRHGIGELLQGNVAPDSILIESWTQGPLATSMGGEPGITLIPNLLLTGVLVLIVAIILIVWSAGFVQKRNGGWILFLLSAAMLLVGGGIATTGYRHAGRRSRHADQESGRGLADASVGGVAASARRVLARAIRDGGVQRSLVVCRLAHFRVRL